VPAWPFGQAASPDPANQRGATAINVSEPEIRRHQGRLFGRFVFACRRPELMLWTAPPRHENAIEVGAVRTRKFCCHSPLLAASLL
jgi:hypothetical protein